MERIAKILEKRSTLLVFCLLCGAAYFLIALRFILTYTSAGGGLLAFFFFPAIICGMALILFKAIAKWQEEQKTKAVGALAVVHVVLFIISIVFLLDVIHF